MTREEAIRIATGLRTDFKCESDTMVDFCNTVIKALEQESCEDAISRQAVLDCLTATGLKKYDFILNARNKIKSLPSVKPQTVRCKDCKWWKDSDGFYHRGVHAESKCPINRREVFEGNGYCYMYEPKERSDKG